eukprot:jgi/Chrzof1/9995/Cz04g23110.t1
MLCMVHRALAALLKELSKTGSADMAFEIFDWLRSLDEDHELAGLCDVYTYTTMIHGLPSRWVGWFTGKTCRQG